MPSTCCSHGRLFVYYGQGGVDVLERFERVVLQPTRYSPAELERLRQAGTRPLAYLSLTEDTGPEAPWQRPSRNPAWGGRYVDVGHPGWRAHVARQANAALARGFTGLFLDTLEPPPGHPEDAAALLELVAELRRLVDGAGASAVGTTDASVPGPGYLLANRGLTLHRQLAPLVDAFLFEAYSTTWEDGYRSLGPAQLQENVKWLGALQATGRQLYLLDYANRPQLAAFAASRAATQGLPLQVTNREVSCLPDR